MKYLFTIWFLCFTAASTAQPRQVIDSIQAIIDTLGPEEKVNAYIDIATEYQFLRNGYDSISANAQRALQLAEEYDLSEGKQKAHYYLGMAHWYGNEDYAGAFDHFAQTRELIIESGNLKKLHQVDNALGAVKLLDGQYKDALVYFQDAFDGSVKEEDYATLAIISTNMGIIYNTLNDTLKAIDINLKALEYLQKDFTKDKLRSTITVKLNLADLYRRRSDLDNAKAVLQELRVLVDSVGYVREELRLISAETAVLKELGEEDKLFKLITEKKHLFDNIQGYDNTIYSTIMHQYGLGLIKRERRSEAESIVQQLKERLGHTNIAHKRNLYQFIYDLESELGNYKEAFTYLDEFKVLNDSILNEKSKNEIVRLEALYDLEKKEKLIERNEKDNLLLKKRNNTLVSLLLGFSLLSLILYFLMYRKRQQEKEKIYQIEQKMLSLQMNPHFIFNAISSIQNYLFDEGDSKMAIHHLSTFASLMRQMLENSREKFIPLDEEIDFLKNYLDLQKLRFDDKFEYEIEIAPDIDSSRISIPPLLTQPFVENAIDHGKIYLVKDGKLHLKIDKQNEDIVIQIKDNGVGMHGADEPKPESLVIKKRSLSISITNERLQLLSKLMQKKFYLEIKPNDNGPGTVVYLNIPAVDTNQLI